MPSEGSITHWISRLKEGDDLAAEKLWQQFFQSVVRLARSKLKGQSLAVDEEDVALSAFKSICLGASRGRFPQLIDRDSLWRLLVVVTARKAIDRLQHERRQKRGGGRVRAIGVADDGTGILDIEQVCGREPSPEFVALMADECEKLLSRLDDELRAIALWKMEGFSHDEIAARLGCVQRTVERKVRLIRKKWSHEGAA